MSLKGLPGVLDIRTVGLVAGIDLASRPDAVGKRGFEIMDRGFNQEDITLRAVGDTLALTPPLIMTRSADRRDLRQGRQAHPRGDVGRCPRSAGRERRLRPQDRPADREFAVAAPERQRERRLHLRVARERRGRPPA